MNGSVFVVWPEGEPKKARFARTRLGKVWLRIGPFGLLASFRGRRICTYWPALLAEGPARVASNWEEARALHRKYFGDGR